jgi:hypothetical protein
MLSSGDKKADDGFVSRTGLTGSLRSFLCSGAVQAAAHKQSEKKMIIVFNGGGLMFCIIIIEYNVLVQLNKLMSF